MYHSQDPQDGAASWGLPFSSSNGYYQKLQYAQPSAYSSGHHTGKPQQVTPTSSRITQRAYTQQIGEDVISARIQNLNLSANPSHSSKNFTAGENRQSRSALPPREISLPGWVSPSSKSASAASYNPVCYGDESKTPPNAKPPRAKPGGATKSYTSATHCSPSSIRLRDEPVLVSPARSDYCRRFFDDLSSPGYSPLSFDESCPTSDSSRSSDDGWPYEYYADYDEFW